MAKLNSAEEKILEDVSKWKANDPAFFTRATHTLAKPLVWAADKLIPEDVRGSLGKVSEGIAASLSILRQNLLQLQSGSLS